MKTAWTKLRISEEKKIIYPQDLLKDKIPL